jgi:hypothetical protein
MARLLRLAVGTYRAIDAAPPWAWMLAGVAVTVGILEVIA